MKINKLVLLATAVLLSLSAVYAAESVRYPDGFRRWVHVGTAVSKEEMHHIFANQEAANGYASGNFRDGSIIVFEVRETQQKGNEITEGDRKRVDVMIKDSSHYASTGGWRFERFWGTDQLHDAIDDSGASCFQCHARISTHGSVFSRLQ